LYKQLADISFYQRPSDEISKTKSRSELLGQEILDAYKRWEYLERCKE
jgi:hypothetical protein